MRGRRTAKAVVGILAVALVAPNLVATAGGAEERDAVYITEVLGRPLEPYTELPGELNQGAPSTDVELQKAPFPIHCEAISAIYEPSVVADGVITVVSEGRYQDPQKAWVHNPADSKPSKAEVGAAPGPHALAECPMDTAGDAHATFGRYVSDNLSIESSSSDTTNKKLAGENLIVSETTNKVQGLKIGPLSIASVFSWLKVEFRPSEEPKVSYRIELAGIRNGDQTPLSAAGGEGIVVLQGQKLVGDDLVAQFNRQVHEHEDAIAPLAKYKLRILQPRFTRNQYTSADRGASSVYGYYYEVAALDGLLEPTARQNNAGHGFGFRLGVSRVGGDFNWYGG